MLTKYKVAALPCLINCVIIKLSYDYELIELKGLNWTLHKNARLEKFIGKSG